MIVLQHLTVTMKKDHQMLLLLNQEASKLRELVLATTKATTTLDTKKETISTCKIHVHDLNVIYNQLFVDFTQLINASILKNYTGTSYEN